MVKGRHQTNSDPGTKFRPGYEEIGRVILFCVVGVNVLALSSSYSRDWSFVTVSSR